MFALLAICAALSADPPAPDLPRLPALSAEEALRAFRVAPGFEIQLVACEPDVVDPVAAAFDEFGRLWVVEMRDYPFTLDDENLTKSDLAHKQPSGRVRILEDPDGDGRFERASAFADGFHWPTGIALWAGGAFVCAAPDIVYLRDTDNDGRADQRRVVWTGFTRKNVQALVNNLKWGLDGRIWGALGGNEAHVTSPSDSSKLEVTLRGRDFRFDPRGGPMESVPGGGQFGMSFGDFGERFVCSNSNHLRHVVLEESAEGPAVADIAIDGPAAKVYRASPPEPWRVERTRQRAGQPDAVRRYAPTELVPTGFFTSASGVTIYRGDLFPPAFRGNAFIGDVGGNLVHRKVLEPAGCTFTAHRPPGEETREFLTSSDSWFRPVNFAEGPDGALYVLDMYRETIEHPFSIPDPLKAKLDLLSGNDRGRIWRIVPSGAKSPHRGPVSGRLTANAPALAGLLSHSNAWWRETAARILLERFPDVVPLELVAHLDPQGSPLARAHALWLLHRMALLKEPELARALRDPHPRVV